MLHRYALAPLALAALAAPLAHAQIVADGSFEAAAPSGNSPAWEETSTNFGTPLCSPATCGGASAHTGQWFAFFGGSSTAVETGTLQQTVTIPSNASTLTFYLRIGGTPGGSGFLRVLMDGNELFRVTKADQPSYLLYTIVSLDVRAYANNATHMLRFESTTQPGGVTNFAVDDVEIATGTASEGEVAARVRTFEASPNPVRGTGRVAVELVAAEAVRVEVLDVLGRRVALLHDGPLAAGRQAFALDAARLAPGAYVVRLQGATFSDTRRVTVAR